MRSLWSRDCDGSITVVGPSAVSAASRMADFTWALATGVPTMVPRNVVPCTASGAKLPLSRPRTSAPMEANGWPTRRIGRRRREASPSNTKCRPARPASKPSISRIVVPELPQSRMCCGSWRPSRPTPSTVTIFPASIGVIPTPMALRQAAVLIGSSAGKSPSIVVVPSAMAPNKRERCEIDLSPGTLTRPWRHPPVLRSRDADALKAQAMLL